MPQTTLTVKLVGSEDDDGFVRFDEFTGFCRALSKCLRRISDAANPGGDKIYYRVVAMEAASAAVTLEAIHPTAGKNRGEAVFRLFRDTAIRLQDGKAPDKRLTFEDIEAFRELLLPLDRHASEVWVDGFQLTFERRDEHREHRWQRNPVERRGDRLSRTSQSARSLRIRLVSGGGKPDRLHV